MDNVYDQQVHFVAGFLDQYISRVNEKNRPAGTSITFASLLVTSYSNFSEKLLNSSLILADITTHIIILHRSAFVHSVDISQVGTVKALTGLE